jgi:hypothetical protein
MNSIINGGGSGSAPAALGSEIIAPNNVRQPKIVPSETSEVRLGIRSSTRDHGKASRRG